MPGTAICPATGIHFLEFLMCVTNTCLCGNWFETYLCVFNNNACYVDTYRQPS